MIGRLVEGERYPSVICAWCGSEMRRARARDESEREVCGMCQACFRQMVEEHMRVATTTTTARTYASER